MKTGFYLLIDGMTETIDVENSSLSKAVTPNIDWLASIGNMGFYLPEKEPRSTEPKTDIVIPSFFGISPELNPGRTCLELIDLGFTMNPGEYCFSLIIDPSNSIVSSQIINNLYQKLSIISKNHNIICAISEASNYGDKFLFGNCKEENLDIFFEKIKSIFRDLNLTEEYKDIKKIPDQITSIKNTRNDLVFLGWAKGSLRGAFKLLGAACNPFTRKTESYFDWDSYTKNFHSWIVPLLKQTSLKHSKTFVLYTKETAFASRQGQKHKKIEGIEFMDRMLGDILTLLQGEIVVLIASDHSCNIGGSNNPQENTSYLLSKTWIGKAIKKSTNFHFCEKQIINQGKIYQIPQSELVNIISKLRE